MKQSKLDQVVLIIKSTPRVRWTPPENELEAIKLVDYVCEGECGDLNPKLPGFESRWLEAIEYFKEYFKSYAEYWNEWESEYRGMYE